MSLLFSNGLRVSLLSLSTALLYIPTTAHAQTHRHDEIITTGSLIPSSRTNQAIGVSVIGPDQLQQNMASSIGEILKSQAGISSTFFGAGASRPIIRGQGGARVLMLDNGIASIDAASSSPDHAPALEPALATRIEIVRGAGLLRYGSAASGGVINVIDGRIPDPKHEDENQGVINLGAASIDNSYQWSLAKNYAVHPTQNQTIILHGEYAKRYADDYKVPNQAVSDLNLKNNLLENSDANADNFALGITHQDKNRLMGAAFKNINSEYGLPGGEGARIQLSQKRADFKAHFDLDGNIFEHFDIAAGIADYKHVEVEPSGEIGTIFTNQGGEIRAEILQKSIPTIFGQWQGAHGLHYNTRDFTAIGEEAFVPPTKSKMIAAFSFHEFDLGDWSMEAAGRVERSNVKDDANHQREFTSISASLGMAYDLDETHSLAGHLFRTERAPNSDELFANGLHLATGQFEIGDLNLGQEIAKGIELSWQVKNDRGQLRLNGFYTDYDDYIYQSQNGDIYTSDEGDALAIARTVADDVNFYGFEIIGDYDIGQWQGMDWSVDFSVESVTAKLVNGDQSYLPRIPPLGIDLGLEIAADKLTNRFELSYAAMQNNTAPFETASDDYVLLNWLVAYELCDDLNLDIGIKNLTNAAAYQHSSYLKDSIALPGRSFTARVRYRF